jgi:carboxypeptidase Q
MVDAMKADGLDNVHAEAVSIPYWIRGEESATLLSPRIAKLNILGLGSSVGTPVEGITADCIVVSNYTDLKARAAEVPGKFVVYNSECGK